MGHRANLVIVENGTADVRFDQWGALSLPGYLFWGPHSSLAYFRSCDQPENGEWLDHVWCEGAALMDLDHKVMMFFGGDELEGHIPQRREYLALMGKMWPGWEIRWAVEGLADIAEYAGMGRDKVIARNEKEVLSEENLLAALTGHGEQDENTYAAACLSFKSTDGKLKLFLSEFQSCEAIVGFGAGLINLCRNQTGIERLNLNCFPASGIHIDEQKKLIEYWVSGAMPQLLDEIKRAWEPYEIRFIGNDFEKHLNQCGGRLSINIPGRTQLLEAIKPVACLDIQEELMADQSFFIRMIIKAMELLSYLTKKNASPKLPPMAARRKIFDEIAASPKP